jgi:hypothetical protein
MYNRFDFAELISVTTKRFFLFNIKILSLHADENYKTA